MDTTISPTRSGTGCTARWTQPSRSLKRTASKLTCCSPGSALRDEAADHGPAARQIDEIDQWWREHRSSSEALREELARALGLLKAAPEQGPLYLPRAEQGFRRVLLQRSQHYVYYVVNRRKELIRILAVWSCYRGAPPLPGDRR